MPELRDREPDRGPEQPARPPRPDAAQHRIPDTGKSGAERLRLLYGGEPRGLPHGDGGRIRGSAAGRDAGTRQNGRPHVLGGSDGPRRGKVADETPPSAHSDRGDGQRRRDDPRAESIDPRLLAGVPRPRAALPDDTGRAYLIRPSETRGPVHGDGRADSVRAADADGAAGRDRQREGERADSRRRGDRGERLEAWVGRPAFQDPFGNGPPPDRYGNPLTLPDGSRIPRFNDRPTREQTAQGRLNDCGVIATLGAVASHRPGDIVHRIGIEADGMYRVRLNEASCTSTGAKPTGRILELSVTPELPVYEPTQGRPAFAKAEGDAAWSPIMEKAIAGVDQTWTSSRRAEWEETWDEICREDVAEEKERPRSGAPPEGYVRLNQGSTPWDRAELLTQLTGQGSVVRLLPCGDEDILTVFEKQLAERKPVLVASRQELYEGEELPHELDESHAYEVTQVRDGKIILRNPWNHTHPEPMTPAQFSASMSSAYTTLK